MLHIYTEAMQPATNWTDTHSCEPMQMGFEPDKLIYAHCCGQQRPAKDCVVQSYYDVLSIWCAPEKGCKDPQVIAAKKAREFANRSAGQKARWAKASNGQAQRPEAASPPKGRVDRSVMPAIHLYAPKPTSRWIRAGTCPDCKKRTRFLGWHYEWYGSDQVCLRCGREWSDGEWMPLPFMRGARAHNIAEAKDRWRRGSRHDAGGEATGAALCDRSPRP